MCIDKTHSQTEKHKLKTTVIQYHTIIYNKTKQPCKSVTSKVTQARITNSEPSLHMIFTSVNNYATFTMQMSGTQNI